MHVLGITVTYRTHVFGGMVVSTLKNCSVHDKTSAPRQYLEMTYTVKTGYGNR